MIYPQRLRRLRLRAEAKLLERGYACSMIAARMEVTLREMASLAGIRNAVDAAVRATSLRAVAVQVEMSPTGLSNFLNERAPHRWTVRKLRAWYVRYQHSQGEFSPDVAQAGLHVLLEAIPDEQFDHASARLLACLDEIRRDSQIGPPTWLNQLREARSDQVRGLLPNGGGATFRLLHADPASVRAA